MKYLHHPRKNPQKDFNLHRRLYLWSINTFNVTDPIKMDKIAYELRKSTVGEISLSQGFATLRRRKSWEKETDHNSVGKIFDDESDSSDSEEGTVIFFKKNVETGNRPQNSIVASANAAEDLQNLNRPPKSKQRLTVSSPQTSITAVDRKRELSLPAERKRELSLPTDGKRELSLPAEPKKLCKPAAIKETRYVAKIVDQFCLSTSVMPFTFCRVAFSEQPPWQESKVVICFYNVHMWTKTRFLIKLLTGLYYPVPEPTKPEKHRRFRKFKRKKSLPVRMMKRPFNDVVLYAKSPSSGKIVRMSPSTDLSCFYDSEKQSSIQLLSIFFQKKAL
eukprot:TRINITY_DN14387_c0_g1_i1.p1 TRINITY_DN14387_c0_g1~~TRINITY_DN14387_c0_g1_i1.p1  ORF type:complete len:333 (+),score=35.20 TRINITY_DN14387_c0_g1_i1:234-1232(+)